MIRSVKIAFSAIPTFAFEKANWLYRGSVRGFGDGRVARYFWFGVGGVCAIWLVTVVYLTLAPRSYVSEFTFVLPGAGAGASINLEQIGQASSLSQSPFSNKRVNPTESYKRLLLSSRVRAAAKQVDGVDWLPRPHVKLLDQTQFMEVSVSGATPVLAHQYAVAFETAFLAEVDALRGEERRAREAGYREMIAEFEGNVSAARAALLAHQSLSGLASLSQFNESVARVDNLKATLNEAQIAADELARQRDALFDALGLTKGDAKEALLLAADPAFITLADAHAEKETYLSETVYKFGQNHPQRIKAEREHHGLTDEIAKRAHRHIHISREKALRYARLLSSDEYSALLRTAIENNAIYEAAWERSDKLASTLATEKANLEELSIAAAQLDNLIRAHQVAEAVFRSAMARIDTNKTDLFASYPLIQTVERPFTPDQPSSPMVAFALVGAFGATVLYIMGLALLCIRLPILNALSKKR